MTNNRVFIINIHIVLQICLQSTVEYFQIYLVFQHYFFIFNFFANSVLTEQNGKILIISLLMSNPYLLSHRCVYFIFPGKTNGDHKFIGNFAKHANRIDTSYCFVNNKTTKWYNVTCIGCCTQT